MGMPGSGSGMVGSQGWGSLQGGGGQEGQHRVGGTVGEIQDRGREEWWGAERGTAQWMGGGGPREEEYKSRAEEKKYKPREGEQEQEQERGATQHEPGQGETGNEEAVNL